MKTGCLLALLLLPITIVIWAKKERARRAALPPDELKELEDEERYGKIDDSVECIYCHKMGCVRTEVSMADKLVEDLRRSRQEWINVKNGAPEHTTLKVRCMNCGSYWDMFDPSEKTNP